MLEFITKYDRDINELSSASCIYKVRDICIVLVDNNKWRKQKALSPLHVDYAYICRGFYGSVADLKRLFQIKTSCFRYFVRRLISGKIETRM